MSRKVDEKMGSTYLFSNSPAHFRTNSSTHPPTNPSTHPPSSEVAIKVEHISKKYCKSLKRSMLYGVHDIGRNMIGLRSRSHRLRKNEFWAVDDVSFEVRKGETLGIIGPNGSGKTTLLKMLNGIFWPDKGKITVKGRVGALIEVGAGFHPLLTGRENIYVNSAIMGMTKKEVDEKFSDIVEFAEIGDFIDTPVKFYSSGMFVRLGFAIAVHCNPDILLVDEVLAVGDIGFRAKCYNKIAELVKNCAVIIVSHHTPAVARTCSKCIVLSEGHCVFNGLTELAIQKYFSLFESREMSITESKGVYLVRLTINSRCKNGHYLLKQSDPLSIDLDIKSDHSVKRSIVMLHFHSESGEVIAEWNSRFNGDEPNLQKGLQHFSIFLPSLKLSVGLYDLSFIITSKNRLEHLLWISRGWRLRVLGDPFGVRAYQVEGSIRSESRTRKHSGK